MEKISELFKVLSDETRLRIINIIYRQDVCVCELVEILNLPQPKISKHIAKLRQINLVNTNRNEQYIYYSLNKESKEYNHILDTVFRIPNNVLSHDIENLQKVETFICSK